jgi:DNA-binding winged helix-turn-helix (wHTH) protein
MTYDFDELELDEAAFELRRGGRRIDVQPKVLSVLLFLIKNRSRFVSKDELLAALWPSETVGRTSLPKAVYGARQLLLDNGLSGSMIRTVWGRGYRFMAPVSEGASLDGALRDERAAGGSIATPSRHPRVGARRRVSRRRRYLFLRG